MIFLIGHAKNELKEEMQLRGTELVSCLRRVLDGTPDEDLSANCQILIGMILVEAPLDPSQVFDPASCPTEPLWPVSGSSSE